MVDRPPGLSKPVRALGDDEAAKSSVEDGLPMTASSDAENALRASTGREAYRPSFAATAAERRPPWLTPVGAQRRPRTPAHSHHIAPRRWCLPRRIFNR